MVSQISTIEHIEVASEVEALLLESKLIKKFRPPYNIAAKDDKSPYYIHITREDFPQPRINHEQSGAITGPFLSGYTARSLLKHFRRIAPYCTAHRPVTHPCFYSHLDLCRPCPALGDRAGYSRNIIRLKKLLCGQFSKIYSQLKIDMTAHAKALEYEQAGIIKNYLLALDQLLHTPISPDDYIVNPNLTSDRRQAALTSLSEVLSLPRLHRIEMYDVANLSGTSATSAMTIAIDGEVSPRAYRHFTIKYSTPNDVAMMSETLTRRLKRTDWPTPDLIVLDGGKSQLSILKNIHTAIPVIALAKKEEVLTIPKDGDFVEIKLPTTNSGLQLLQNLRDEAHRFSRRLHHKHTRQKMLK